MHHLGIGVRRRRFSKRGVLFLFSVCALVAIIPSFAYANPTSQEKQAEAQATLASLNVMQETLDKAAVLYDDALAAQKQAQEKSNEAKNRLDQANNQITDLQTRLATRVKSMYRNGSTSFLDVLLGSKSFQAFSTNWDILNSINASDEALVAQTKDLRAEAQKQEEAFMEQQHIATEKADAALQSKNKTASTIAAMKATYDSLSAEASALVEQERTAQQVAEAARAPKVLEAAQQSAETIRNAPDLAPKPADQPGFAFPEPVASFVPGSVLDRAYSQLGKPYGYEDASYGAGPTHFDCSGFVAFCLSGSYTRMGSTNTFLTWPRVSNPQPGDVAVNASHAGIYIGNGQMIHAATYGVGVIVGPVQGGMVFVRG